MSDVISIIDNYRNRKYRSALRYYVDLRNAVYEELNTTGRCQVIEEYVNSGGFCESITYFSLKDAVESFARGKVPTQSDDRYYYLNDKIPVSWKDMVKYKTEASYNLSVLYNAAKERFNKTNSQFMYGNPVGFFVEEYTDDFGSPAIANDGGEKVRSEPVGVDSALSSNEEEAERRAQEILNDANEKAKRIIEDAERQAGLKINNAKETEESILKDAEEKKHALIEEVEGYRRKVIAAAEDEKRAIINADVQGKVEHLVKSQLGTYVEKRCVANRDQVDRMVEMQREVADESNAIKDTVSKGIGEVKTVVSETISSAIEAFENSMLSKVYEWQSAMYQGDFGPLATCYVNLQKLLKIMNEEISSTANNNDDISLAVRDALVKHYEKFNNFSNQLMRTMNRIGIKSYMPQVGEEFNSYFHTHNNEQEFVDDEAYNGKVITCCLEAGFIQVRGNNETVIFRAVVDTK